MYVSQPVSHMSESLGALLIMQIPKLLQDLLNYFGEKAKFLDLLNIPNDFHLCLNLRIISLR